MVFFVQCVFIGRTEWLVNQLQRRLPWSPHRMLKTSVISVRHCRWRYWYQSLENYGMKNIYAADKFGRFFVTVPTDASSKPSHFYCGVCGKNVSVLIHGTYEKRWHFQGTLNFARDQLFHFETHGWRVLDFQGNSLTEVESWDWTSEGEKFEGFISGARSETFIDWRPVLGRNWGRGPKSACAGECLITCRSTSSGRQLPTWIIWAMGTVKGSLNTQVLTWASCSGAPGGGMICVWQLRLLLHDGIYRNQVERGRTSQLDDVAIQPPPCNHHLWTDNAITGRSCLQYCACVVVDCLIVEGNRQKTR